MAGVKNVKLQYPINPNPGDSNRKSYIIFTPRVFKFLGDDSKKIIDSVKNAVSGQGGGSLINDLKSGGKELLNRNLNYTRENFDQLLNNVVSTGKEDEDKKALQIHLPMRQVVLDLNHNWQAKQVFQGGAGGAESAGIQAGATALQQTIQSALSNVGGGDIVSSMLGALTNTALSTSGGYFIQPTRAAYSGTDPINLVFNYTFSPQSPNEALRIKKIVNTFKYLSTTQSGPDAYKTALLFGKNPAIWKISFIQGTPKEFANEKSENIFQRLMIDTRGDIGQEEALKNSRDNKKNLQSLSPAEKEYYGVDQNTIQAANDEIEKYSKNELSYMVLKQVSTNYGDNPNSWVSFPDGFPNVITLTLSFTSYFSVQSAQTLFGYSSIDQILNEGDE